MIKKMQEGIYYTENFQLLKSKSSRIRNRTFGLLSLRFRHDSDAEDIGGCLTELWEMYQSLKKGRVGDLHDERVPTGSLDVLIGYGPNVFGVRSVKKRIPRDMCQRQFSFPSNKGQPIVRGSGIKYSLDVHENLGFSEDIIVQFISNTQLGTYRAIVETWHHLSGNDSKPLLFSKFFTGFERDDGRSWLGFHDGISNMKNAQERKGAIAVHRKWNHLSHDDYWTENGTYLAFLKIVIDLPTWKSLQRKQQELIVGRDKITGKPIIAIDKSGLPITDESCPEMDKVSRHVAIFHDHPNYFMRPRVRGKSRSSIDFDESMKILNQSHIGRTRHIENIDSRDPSSNRIFRQAFEFMEASSDPSMPIKLGLNFVSFQNDPKRVFSLIASPHWLGSSNFGGGKFYDGIDRMMSVDAAGMFFVPGMEEPFPGASIFI